MTHTSASSFYKIDTTPWAIFPSETYNGLIPHFWWRFLAHPSPKILTKQNIKETANEGNILDPFYMSKGEGLGGG